MRKEYTTIRVSKETLELLKSVKKHPRQSYGEVFVDCLNNYADMNGIKIKW